MNSHSDDDGFDAIKAGDERERRIIEKVDRFEESYKRATAELGVPPHIGEYERLSPIMRLELADLPAERSYEVIKSAISELRPIFEVFPDFFDHARTMLSVRMPGQGFHGGYLDGRRFVDIKKEHDAVASQQDSLKDVLTERNARTDEYLENERTKKTHERRRALTADEIQAVKDTSPFLQRLLQSPKTSIQDYRSYSSDFNIVLYTHYQSRVFAIANRQRSPISAEEEVELVKKSIEDYQQETLKKEFDLRFDSARSELRLPPKGQKSKEREREYAQFISEFAELNQFFTSYKERMGNKEEATFGKTLVKQASKIFRG